jgi:hypothetical protein
MIQATNTNKVDWESLPILEPLSNATGLALRNDSQIPKDSYLFISITANEKFHCKVVSCSETKPKFSESKAYPTTGNTQVYKTGGYLNDKSFRFIERIPESTRVKIINPGIGESGSYVVAPTDYTALVIHYGWPKDQIVFLDEHSEILFNFVLKRFLMQTTRAKMQADYLTNGDMPKMPSSFYDLEDVPLSDYQKCSVAFHHLQEGGANFMEQGTGKSAIFVSNVATAARHKWNNDDKKISRVLLVVPKQVRKNWVREFSRFTTVPGRVTIVKGNAMERMRLMIKGIKPDGKAMFGVVIASFDSVSADIETLKKVPWDMIGVDESHMFKSPKTNRWKALRRLRDSSKRRLIMTGTPIGNTLSDMYTQLEFLGEGMSGFSSHKAFNKFHVKHEATGATVNGQAIEAIVGFDHIPLLHERLSRCAFIITKEQAGLQLPEKLAPSWWEVQMSKEQARIYKDISDKLVAEIRDDIAQARPDQKHMVVEHALTKLLRLNQITSGHISTKSLTGKKLVRQIDTTNPKLEALKEILADTDPKCKTVIWAIYVEDIRIISEMLTKEGIKHGTYNGATSEKDRELNVDSFNQDPEFKVLVCHPASAGTGLDLLGYDKLNPDDSDTYAGQVINFSYGWSYLQMSQLVDRVHRRGTRMPIHITQLVCPGTIDETILERIDEKADTAELARNIESVLCQLADQNLEGPEL